MHQKHLETLWLPSAVAVGSNPRPGRVRVATAAVGTSCRTAKGSLGTATFEAYF